MYFEFKPNYDEVYARYEAFWNRSVLDRPPVCIALPKRDRKPSIPAKTYASHAERWLDVDYRAEQMERGIENTNYMYDSLPIAWPNLGPEIFSAMCGCGYNYGADTTWSEPVIIERGQDDEKARFNMDHPLNKTLERFTRQLIERGKGRFIVGLSDFHPGGDHIAALRDPQELAFDMIEEPDWVKEMLAKSYPEYYAFYEHYYNMLTEAGMPCTTWTPLVHHGKYYVPSNDFSCMISKKMFDDVFLPGIAEECKKLDRSIYHLDGPGALRHLDSLLEIPELDAVQWVVGAGNEGYAKWVPVYQKIQNAGKSIQLIVDYLDDLPLIFETLRPEGVWFSNIAGIDSEETAHEVVKRITAWK